MITQLTDDQAGQIATINALNSALAAAFVLTVDYTKTVGMSLVITGGHVPGATVDLADQTVTLTASATTYVEADAATYVVSSNTSGYTSGKHRVGIATTNTEGLLAWKQDFYPGSTTTP